MVLKGAVLCEDRAVRVRQWKALSSAAQGPKELRINQFQAYFKRISGSPYHGTLDIKTWAAMQTTWQSVTGRASSLQIPPWCTTPPLCKD